MDNIDCDLTHSYICDVLAGRLGLPHLWWPIPIIGLSIRKMRLIGLVQVWSYEGGTAPRENSNKHGICKLYSITPATYYKHTQSQDQPRIEGWGCWPSSLDENYDKVTCQEHREGKSCSNFCSQSQWWYKRALRFLEWDHFKKNCLARKNRLY